MTPADAVLLDLSPEREVYRERMATLIARLRRPAEAESLEAILLRAALDLSPMGCVIVDSTGRVIFATSSLCRRLGGMPVTDCPPIRRALAGKVVASTVTVDGGTRMSVWAYPIYAGPRGLVGAVAYFEPRRDR